MGEYYDIKDPAIAGTETEANLIKHWKAKSVEKMKKVLYQQAAGREAPSYRQLSTFLGEHVTNSYLHAAIAHRTLWGPYDDIEKNLEALITQEHDHAYHSLPEYAKIAREEGFDEIADAFEMMANVDAVQEKKLSDILDKLKSDTIFQKSEPIDWYCQTCGHVHNAASAPESCPLCKAPQRFFEPNGANFSTF